MAQLTYKDLRKAIRTMERYKVPKIYYHGLLPDGTEGTIPAEELCKKVEEKLKEGEEVNLGEKAFLFNPDSANPWNH